MAQKVEMDYSAAEAALEYLERPAPGKLKELLGHTAYRLIVSHSRRYCSRPLSAQTLAQAFRKGSPEAGLGGLAGNRAGLAAALKYLKENEPAIRDEFLSLHLRYLPQDYCETAVVRFALGGCDGIALDGQVVVNLNDGRFLADRRELLLSLPHELFHLGFEYYRGLPDLAAARTVGDLKEFVMEFTMNEGLATLVPYEKRRSAGALDARDYSVLESAGDLEKKLRVFDALLWELEARSKEALTGGFRDRILEELSRERLFYIAGCHKALAIERSLGREKLAQLVRFPASAFIYWEV
ncbi:MAG: hypothetical protein M0011_03810 [Elusimicrobia bacterium]|nr:hypothetical protein [Elusimicrobiota bacterium]